MSVQASRTNMPVVLLKEGSTEVKGREAQKNNIAACKIIAEIVQTSLGPRGMDKMLVDSLGDVTITNDGATILKEIDVQHPAAKMLVEIASENIPSPAVREAIISDFGNRYAEGWPGERVYAGCVYIDEVEFECMKLAKKIFKAKFADVRPISGVVANLAVYSAFTNPGDVMIAPSIPAGGHISHGKKEHSGTAGLVHGLEIEFYPFDAEEMTIDVDKTKQKVKDLKKIRPSS